MCGASIAEFALSRHNESARCRARQLARKLRDRDLVPCSYALSGIQHIIAALKLFGFPHERKRTKTETPIRKTPMIGDHCWTTPEGAAVVHVIDRTSRFLHQTFPATARRLHERQDLLAQLVTIAALGGAPSKALYQLLRPIDYKEELSGRRTYRWAEDHHYHGDTW